MADDARLVLDGRALALGSQELPGAPVELAPIVERGVVLEIRRLGEWRRALEVLGACREELIHLTERSHHEPVFAGRLRAHTQRYIEALGQDVYAPVAHVE